MEKQVEVGKQQSCETDDLTTNTKYYPLTMAEPVEYQQLVQSSELFLQKLKDFHSYFHTQFIPPCIEGTTLDLHRLFVEVTSRGGLNQVIAERKWNDVVSTCTVGITSFKKSFLLRKYYSSLLYHFEQAYFLKKKAPEVSITEAAKQIGVIGSNKQATLYCNEGSAANSHFQACVQIQPETTLVGVIDEKLDNGYVVSVNMGSDTLKGILYHIPDKPPPAWSPNLGISRRRKRKKSHLSLVEYATLNPMPQGQEKSFSNVGHTWNPLSKPEMQIHQNGGLANKESERTEVLNPASNLR
ncbi:unnamed protein product [Amaranthus hypochondriacus]